MSKDPVITQTWTLVGPAHGVTYSSNSTDSTFSVSSESTTVSSGFTSVAGSNSVVSSSTHSGKLPDDAAVNAVYGYLKAVRALNRDNVSINEISSALTLPRPAVINALSQLRDRGVKYGT